MNIGECFEMLTNGNKAIQASDSKLVYYTRVSIQNTISNFFIEKDCSTEEEFFNVVREVAESLNDDGNFYVNLLCKSCDWEFDDGKVTVHWADSQIGKMITVHLMMKLKINYNYI